MRIPVTATAARMEADSRREDGACGRADKPLGEAVPDEHERPRGGAQRGAGSCERRGWTAIVPWVDLRLDAWRRRLGRRAWRCVLICTRRCRMPCSEMRDPRRLPAWEAARFRPPRPKSPDSLPRAAAAANEACGRHRGSTSAPGPPPFPVGCAAAWAHLARRQRRLDHYAVPVLPRVPWPLPHKESSM